MAVLLPGITLWFLVHNPFSNLSFHACYIMNIPHYNAALLQCFFVVVYLFIQ